MVTGSDHSCRLFRHKLNSENRWCLRGHVMRNRMWLQILTQGILQPVQSDGDTPRRQGFRMFSAVPVSMINALEHVGFNKV